jgi:hypothetical protein
MIPKHYLITLVLNWCLLHNTIYESDVEGLTEYLDSCTVEEILQTYLEAVEQVTQ